MAYKAEALTLLIDVNPSVNDAGPGEDSFLQKSVTAANMIIQRKMFTDTRATKNEASLILFGTDGTSNGLYEDGGEGYKHITIAKDLGIMDMELLKFINKNIQLGAYCADFLDALVVALDHMHNRCMGRKMEQKVILFTNLNSEFDEDKLDVITRAFKDNDVSLVFVGPDIADGGDDSTDSGHDELKKPMTPQQEKGSKCMRHILDEVDGEGISANEVLPMLSFFESRRRKQVTTFRGPIEIGSSLKINSYAYVKCQQERPPSWKKSSALAEYGPEGQTLKVEMQRSYHHNDEDRNEVNKENTAHAYKYGKTLVPMTDDDKKTLKLDSTKGCVVLGFTSRENVDRKLFSRNTCYMFTPMPDDEHAAVAFSALCHALEEKNMVAIVRFVFRANADPKLGFLSPHIKSSYESLVFVSLPFREDIRQYYFPPLDGGKAEKTNSNQKQAINSLISNMMLVQENEEGEEELLKPKDILNPVTQRFFQCIQYRALNPEQTRIPEIEEYILNAVQPIPELVGNCRTSFDEIKRCFPLQKASKESKTVNMFNEPDNDGGPEEKKQKVETSNESDVFTLHGFAKSNVREIDTADPIGSFSVLVDGASSDTFLDVCEKMKDCTLRLILDSFLDQYYKKAINCLDVMRKECINYKVSSVFNKLLLQIKEETLGKRKNDFWELLKRENILPISKDDAEDSSFNIADAQKFYTPVDEKPSVSKDDPDNLLDDEDDLLDML